VTHKVSLPPGAHHYRVSRVMRWMGMAMGWFAGLAVWSVVTLPLVAAEAPLKSDTSIEVQTHTLRNGMKILVHEDHSIPTVASYIFYRIGSRNERPGTTGLSHFFEHMMFNGARKFGPKEFDRVMEAAGGANNAYTDQDVTVYQDWFPPTALQLIFDLEADRIKNLAFVPKIIESERGVVASERRTSVEANNASLVDEQLWAAAYTAHPYQWPVIGWMTDIEQWKMADLKHHFEVGYAPNNAVLVIAGDVKTAEVLKLARRYLEPIKPHAPPLPVTTVEPEQLGERRVKVTKFAQLPLIELAFHVPASRHADFYALQVLQNILFFGQSSRLYLRLIDRDQLAIAVEGGMKFALDPTLFTIFVQPKENVPVERIEAALYEEIERAKKEPAAEKELRKAKNALLAAFYHQLKRVDGKAHALGNYEIFFGDYRKLFDAVSDYEKVTAADLQRVANYFAEKNRTVAVLVPEKESEEPEKK
jgi:zinc protease